MADLSNLSRKPIDITSDVIVMVENWLGAIYIYLAYIKPLPDILTEGNAETNTWLRLDCKHAYHAMTNVLEVVPEFMRMNVHITTAQVKPPTLGFVP